MNAINQQFQAGDGSTLADADLPQEVRRLQPRMRQIATHVYLNGAATVSDIHQAIEDPPSIYGIRTMLGRLSRKGILKRRKSGRHSSILYLPAIVTPHVRKLVLRAFLDRNFSGSAPAALELLLQLESLGADLTDRRGHYRG